MIAGAGAGRLCRAADRTRLLNRPRDPVSVANEERCRELVELSMAMVTSLAPKIGYDRAAEIAKESAKSGKTVREICLEKKVLPEVDLNRVLDPAAMTEPGGEGSASG